MNHGRWLANARFITKVRPRRLGARAVEHAPIHSMNQAMGHSNRPGVKQSIIHTTRILETVAARAAVRKTERADNMATYRMGKSQVEEEKENGKIVQ